jgi:Flp pilus assembly protein TadD
VQSISKKVKAQILNGTADDSTATLITILKSKNLNLPEITEVGKELMNKGRFEQAGRIFARWAEIEPENPVPWSNLGASLARLRLFKQAREILQHALELNPKSINARINLAIVFQELGDHKLELENALEAVKCDPKSSLAFNNLGTALRNNGYFYESKHAFETSLILNSNEFFARFNLAKLESETGNVDVAIGQFESLLADEERRRGADADTIRFYLACEYLKSGRLSEGWHMYESGFSEKLPALTARSPLRKFKVPKWDGEVLKKGQTLMIWREQGVGDEVMFSSCLKFLSDLEAEIILELDQRLVSVFKRSFPKFHVRTQHFSPAEGMMQTRFDYDMHISLGSLCRIFLPSIEATKGLSPFIVVDSFLKNKFSERLVPYKSSRKIGICWRSGLMSVHRNPEYTLLDDWGDIFSLPNTTFINLQYDECEAELTAAEAKYGIKIVRWDDVDLKNDLESVFALLSNLDAFVSPATAVVPFAGSVGLGGVVMLLEDWVTLGSHDRYPWFPNIRSIVLPRSSYVAHALPRVPQLLEEVLFTKMSDSSGEALS